MKDPSYAPKAHSLTILKFKVFLPLFFREKQCDVVALRSCQRDVIHQYKQVQNGGTETMLHVFFL